MSNCLALFWIFTLVVVSFGKQPVVNEQETKSSFWQQDAQSNLLESLRLHKNEGVAKQIILFLGDGMGITTVTATRIYKGQKKNKTGEEEKLTFDRFPHVSLSKTYGVDRQTSDSANTATAYLCGVKANYGTIGLDGRVPYEDCEASLDPTTHVTSILQWAQDRGMSTGVVTTTRVTHATPSGAYAHTASRNWESSTPNPNCKDIAHQLVHETPGKNIQVVLGGGRRHFLPANKPDIDDEEENSRNDSRDLLKEWVALKNAQGKHARVIRKAEDLNSLDHHDIDYLMGLFHSDHIPYVSDKPELKRLYPTLPQMTEAAIKILSKNSKGFFLLVEGGRIDMAHHANWARKALEEGVEFDEAIETARSMTDEEDTLIVVTADHSHTFSVGGDYPLRGTNIVGIGGVSDVDNMTFTTLGYYNGPGYKVTARDRNLTQQEAINKDFRQDTPVPMEMETHGAEDVPVYAIGPMAHLFHGVHEQSYIPYVMGYAACIGPNQDHCSAAWSLIAVRTAALHLTAAFLVYLFGDSRTFL